MNKKLSRELCLSFAQLLDYPTAELAQQAQDCAGIVSLVCKKGGMLLVNFHDWVAQTPLNTLREVYTSTFDLQGNCPPYIGHQLFGESYKRSWFMARLNKQFREKNFNIGNELPDHVVVVLKFLAGHHTGEFAQVLECEGLRPAVDKMLELFADVEANPYWNVLKALSLMLEDTDQVIPGDDRCE